MSGLLTKTSIAAKRALGISDSSFSINIGIQYSANLPLDVKILRKERTSCSCVIVSSVSVLVTF